MPSSTPWICSGRRGLCPRRRLWRSRAPITTGSRAASARTLSARDAVYDSHDDKSLATFTLESDGGEQVSLESLRGKPVVLYFYPRDDTPGCTAQACGIRDAWGEFEQRGAVVLGVSPDSASSHVKFKDKYGLPFTLLADEDHALAEAYGVWVEKSMAGRTYMGVERSTFVIDADGNVSKVMRRVKPDTHADDVLAALP